MKLWLKLVTDETPDAGGKWTAVDTPDDIAARLPGSWRQAAELLQPFIPSGTHVVAYGVRPPLKRRSTGHLARR